jgi:integrase
MAYAEKREGKLTGLWVGEINRLKTGGVRHKRAFPTKREADAYEAYVRMFGQEPPTVRDGLEQASESRSFATIANQCKAAGGPSGAWLRGRDKNVVQRLDYAIERIGGYDIASVTRQLVREKIVEPLRRTPRPGNDRTKLLKQGTINRYVTAVSAVLKYAENENLIPAKPTLEFRKELDKTERNAISFELEDGIVQRLAQDYPTHAVVVRFLAETGMRLGEVLKLAPEQIKHDHVLLKKEQTKTHQSREVYVRPALAREMRALVASTPLPDPTHLLRTFQAAAKSAGSESHVVVHGLRHTRATRLMQARVPREIRMYMLGHSNQDVHSGYLHVSLEDQRQASEAVEKMRGVSGGQVVHLGDYNQTQPLEKASVG